MSDFLTAGTCTPNTLKRRTHILSVVHIRFCAWGEHHNPNCPVCCGSLAVLATKLPVMQRELSCLVCRLSGKIMDEHNPPAVLPNGFVYSAKVGHFFIGALLNIALLGYQH